MTETKERNLKRRHEENNERKSIKFVDGKKKNRVGNNHTGHSVFPMQSFLYQQLQTRDEEEEEEEEEKG